jgi:hypothetical protein
LLLLTGASGRAAVDGKFSKVTSPFLHFGNLSASEAFQTTSK